MRLILVILIFVSCTSPNKRSKEVRSFYENRLILYKDSLSNLNVEYEKSENYIATAQVHQVTRTPEEKVRQLKNLNAYQVELEGKIQSLERLINSYEDSLLRFEVQR